MQSRSYLADVPAHAVYDAPIRLATWLSMLAAVFAIAARFAGVPDEVVVLTVIVGGFAASWIRSGRAALGACPAGERLAGQLP